MPGILSDLIKDPYSTVYPGREQLLAQLTGRSSAPPPPLELKAPEPLTSSAPSRQYTPQRNINWADINKKRRQEGEEKKQKENIQKAFDEILATRKKLGVPFLDATQRSDILLKNGVPADTAYKINSQINAEQKNAVPKRRLVTRQGEDGSEITGLETDEYIEANPIIRKPTWKQKIEHQLNTGERSLESLNSLERKALGLRLPETKIKKPEDRSWAGQPKKIQNEYRDKFEEIVAKGNDANFEEQGIYNAEDWVFQTGRFDAPKEYTFVPDLTSKILNSFSEDDPRSPEEKYATATEMALQARKKYGSIGTYSKLLADIKKNAAAKKAAAEAEKKNAEKKADIEKNAAAKKAVENYERNPTW